MILKVIWGHWTLKSEKIRIEFNDQFGLKAHLNEKSANLGLDFEMETEKSSKLSNELDENEKLMDDTQKTLRDRFKTLEDKYERLRILQTDYNSMFTKVRVVSSLSFHFLESPKLTKSNITKFLKVFLSTKKTKNIFKL